MEMEMEKEKEKMEMEKKEREREGEGEGEGQGEGQGEIHIVLFPFMAQGHLNPFIDLAFLLLRLCHSSALTLTITFATTPANLPSLQQVFSAHPSVRFSALPFHPSDHNLPSSAEHTRHLSRPAISLLYRASLSLRPHFLQLLLSLRPFPSAVISDMFLAWSLHSARSASLPHAVLYTTGPYSMSIYNSIWTHLPHLLLPPSPSYSEDPLLPPLPDLPDVVLRLSQLSTNMRSTASPDHPSVAFIRQQADLCALSDACLFNTHPALERASLERWRRSSGQPVWAVGPLHLARHRPSGSGTSASPELADWLDRLPRRSAVYVCFGSQSSIGRAQTVVLARGLQASGAPFVWALRPPIGCGADETGLPEGFQRWAEESGRGLVMTKWAPQVEILEHRATGAFVSHCGWNSVMESLTAGVPVIGWPLASEQFYNAKLMVEDLGVCQEIARGEEEMIKEEDVVRIIKEVLEGEAGSKLRARAQALRDELTSAFDAAGNDGPAASGASAQALDDFLRTVVMKRRRDI